MRKYAMLVLLFFVLGSSMPVFAQEFDLKEEIIRFDLATMPQYADANGEYLKERLYQKTEELDKRDKERRNSEDGGGEGFSFPEIDFDTGEIVAIAGITGGIVAAVVILISFVTDDNVIFNGKEY